MSPPRRVYRPRSHKIAEPAPGQWVCLCGAAGAGDASEHLRKSGIAALKRHNAMERGARISLSAHDQHQFITAAVEMLASYRIGLWLSDEQLIPFLAPAYDHWGCLELHIDWAQLAAAVAADRITGDVIDLNMLRIALAIVGAAPINLAQVASHLDHVNADHLIRKALTVLFPEDQP